MHLGSRRRQRIRSRVVPVVAAAVSVPLALVAQGTVAQASAGRVGSAAWAGSAGWVGSTGWVSLAQRPLTEGQAARLSRRVNQRVVVLLKDQPVQAAEGTSAATQRAASVSADQTPLIRELAQVHATHVVRYQLINGFAATVSKGEAARLAANSSVAKVIPDSMIIGPSPQQLGQNLAATMSGGAASSGGPAYKLIPGACLPGGKVELEPEALSLTGVDSQSPQAQTARSLGFTGAGVKVGWMADGIDVNNPNFIKPDGNSVFVAYRDFTGDGTKAVTSGDEAFLDANTIAGQGLQVYNTQGFSAQSPAAPCNIRIEGVAPGVQLVGLKVFGQNNASTTSGFLAAINYAVETEHVNVLNQSFTSNPFPDESALDAIKQADEAATAAGVTITVSTGDAGPFNTIGSPTTLPEVIAAGASTDFRFYAQTNYAGADYFARNGWLDDNISPLSSSGYGQTGATLSLVAPGDLSFASCDASAKYNGCVNFLNQPSDIEESGGTSQAAPWTAGVAALIIQAYRGGHGGATPTPAVVKQIMLSTATDLGVPASEQGAGLVNAYKAVELAESMPAPGAGAPVGQTLLTSTNQLNAVANPGTAESWPVTVTNTGASAQTVRLSGRTFGPAQNVQTATVTLNDKTSKQFINYGGVRNNYSVLHFNVPAGVSRVYASIAYPANPASGNNARVRLILIDPKGRLAAHSIPQGVGNFGNVDVRQPTAGRWTAVIFGDVAADHGTNGTIHFEVNTNDFTSFGSVSPSTLTLAPDASGSVTVRAATPATPGDTSGAIVLNSGNGATSIPVTLRSLVDVAGGGAFSGSVTGGNGRPNGEGQALYYEFNVPAGQTSVNANFTLKNDASDQVSAYFINPEGNVDGYGGNSLATSVSHSGTFGLAPQRQVSVYGLDPVPGTWTLIIDIPDQVEGTEIADPFTGNIAFNQTDISASGLPDSSSATLAAGKPVTVTVSIRNAGAAAEDFFVDPRLNGTVNQTLVPVSQASGVPLPLPATQVPPEWIVPTEVSGMTVTSQASLPAMFDYSPFAGDPDLVSAPTSNPDVEAGSYSPGAGTITSGNWAAYPDETAAAGYGRAKAPSGTVTMSMTAQMQAFDPAVTSTVGDYWQRSVNPAAPYGIFIVNPGQTRTITVTITPAGQPGNIVSGHLYVDDFAASIPPYAQVAGSELAALPYQYKIG
jgi:Subtilase family/Peptidase inhibitor I9